MEKVLLSVHVLAGIVFVGGSAVATSLFPRYAPLAGIYNLLWAVVVVLMIARPGAGA